MGTSGVEVEEQSDTLTGLGKRVEDFAGEVVAGWLADAAPYPDGTQTVTVAASHEFGTSTIPARIPLRSYFDSTGKVELSEQAAELLGDVVDGEDPSDALAELGQTAADGISEGIDKGLQPALKASTANAPGRNPTATPLKDTGHLQEQIDSEVR